VENCGDGDDAGVCRGNCGVVGGLGGFVRCSGGVGSCSGAVGVCSGGAVDGVVNDGGVDDDEGREGRGDAGGGSGAVWA
jgi:hypothetical protein